jgi:hypothetical protein
MHIGMFQRLLHKGTTVFCNTLEEGMKINSQHPMIKEAYVTFSDNGLKTSFHQSDCEFSKRLTVSVSFFANEAMSPPKKQPSNKMGKNIRSPSTEPHTDGEAYIQWGAAWFSRGIVNNTAISNLVPWHDTFHLGLVRPEPCWPVCVISTPNRVYPPHLLLLHTIE